MSRPARRSKWDQVTAVPSGEGSNGSHGSGNAVVYGASGPESSSSNVANSRLPPADVASRTEAFLASALGTPSSQAPSAASSGAGPRGWVPPGHPDYVAPKPVFSDEVNINGCRPEIRYTMTCQPTIDMIKEEYDATVITRGTFRQGDPSSTGLDTSNLAPEDKPLHLYVTADTQDKVDRASARLRTLLERPSTTPSGLLMNKVYIPYAADIDPAFPLPGKIIGPGGSYVKHIQSTTGCKVHLRGKGSSYFEANSRMEAPEALHLFITGPTEKQVQHAKHLSEQLIASVKKKYDLFLAERKGGAPSSNPPAQPPHGGPSSSHQPSHPSHQPQGGYSPSNGPNGPSNSSYGSGPNGPAPPSQPHHAQPQHTPSPPSGPYPSSAPSGGPNERPPSYDRPRSPYGHGGHPSDSSRGGGYGSPRGGPHGGSGYQPQNSYNQGPQYGGAPPAHGHQDYRPDYGRGPQGHQQQTYGNGPEAAAAQQQQQQYSEWTPEAIAAYCAYYGIPMPAGGPQAGYGAQQPPPPPPPSQGASRPSGASSAPDSGDMEMEMEMDMSDDDDKVIVSAKGKRLHADVNADATSAKRGKLEEDAGARPLPPAGQPFWSSTQSK